MGGSGAPHQTTSTTTTQPWGPSIPTGRAYLSAIDQYVTQAMQGVPQGIFQQLAPSNPYQNIALQMFGPATQQAENLTGAGLNKLNYFASGRANNPATNPQLQNYYNAAAQPYVQNYQNAVMPGIMANAEQTGSVGGTGYQTGIQQSQFGLGQGLSNLAAGIYEPAFQQGQQLQFSAAQGLPQAAMSLYGPLSALYGAGATQQQGAQNQLDVNRQNALTQLQYPFAMLNQLGGAFGATAGAGGGSTSIQPIIGGAGGKL